MADGRTDKLGLCDKLIINDWADIIIFSDSLIDSLYIAKYKLYSISMFTLRVATDKGCLWLPRPTISCAYHSLCVPTFILARHAGACQGPRNNSLHVCHKDFLWAPRPMISCAYVHCVSLSILARRAAACQVPRNNS